PCKGGLGGIVLGFQTSSKPMLTPKTTQLRLRHWISLGYTVPVVAFAVAAFVTDLNIRRVRTVTAERDRAGMVSQHIGAIGIEIQISSRTTRGYLLDPSPVSLQSFQASQANYEKELEDMMPLIVDEEQQGNLQLLMDRTQQLMEINAGLIRLASQGQLEAAIQQWKQDSARGLAEEISQILEDMEARQAELVAEDQALATSALNTLQRTVVGACVATILFSIAIGA
ncbi:MAG: CHASE3 domain-containing protein, partial [Prochlorothrix sp.]